MKSEWNRRSHAALSTLRRFVQINRAFLQVGWLNLVSYPLAFFTSQLSALLPVVIYFFVAQLVSPGEEAVGGDYFTYVIIGVLSMKLLDGALRGFGTVLEFEIQAGRLEALLVEPIPWRALPFGMVQFQLIARITVAVMIFLTGLALGAQFNYSGVPIALVILGLGLAVVLAIGILGASVKVLSKRSDPLLTFYELGAMVFSGVYFPVDSLPAFLKPIAYLIPHTYVITALRRVLMVNGDHLPGIDLLTACAALVCLGVVLYPFSLWLYGRSLEVGRRYGLLAGY